MTHQRVAVRPSTAKNEIKRERIRRDRQHRTGLTLVEMLVATVATLLLMTAVVQVFAMLGTSVATGRATITMASQLRAVSHRLQTDIDGLTAPTLPWIDPEAGLGYFEYIEGPDTDVSHLMEVHDGTDHTDTDLLELFEGVRGDMDDILMFTSRSEGKPFRGRIAVDANSTRVIESDVAEIVWWVQRDADGNVNLYRRVLLVRPDLNTAADGTTGMSNDPDFFNFNDISCRPNAQGKLIANSLADLSKRENRFSHRRIMGGADAFPYVLDVNDGTVAAGSVHLGYQVGEYKGDDVALSHMLAFDVRAYDPRAQLVYSETAQLPNSLVLSPGDPGYHVPSNLPLGIAGQGAFVDLNWGRLLPFNIPIDHPFTSSFSHVNPLSDLANAAPSLMGVNTVYDTWPSHYERDNINQDLARDSAAGIGVLIIDEGSDGLDNPPYFGGVDDLSERETAPPFPVPLRGIRVTLRIFEGDSRQVRQQSVVADFVPE